MPIFKSKAERLEEKGDFLEAASEYINEGNSEKAAQMNLKAGYGHRAAELYLQLGQKELATEAYLDYVRNLEAYSSTETGWQIDRKKMDRLRKTGELCQELEKWEDAGNCFGKCAEAWYRVSLQGFKKKPHEQQEFALLAANCYEQARRFDLAANFYKMAYDAIDEDNAEARKHWAHKTATLYRFVGDMPAAAEMYEAAEKYIEAAKLYEVVGRKDKAQDLKRQAGLFEFHSTSVRSGVDRRQRQEVSGALKNTEWVEIVDLIGQAKLAGTDSSSNVLPNNDGMAIFAFTNRGFKAGQRNIVRMVLGNVGAEKLQHICVQIFRGTIQMSSLSPGEVKVAELGAIPALPGKSITEKLRLAYHCCKRGGITDSEQEIRLQVVSTDQAVHNRVELLFIVGYLDKLYELASTTTHPDSGNQDSPIQPKGDQKIFTVGENQADNVYNAAGSAASVLIQACVACHTPLQPGWKHCPSCGREIRKVCPKCGNVLDAKWKVCPYCTHEPN